MDPDRVWPEDRALLDDGMLRTLAARPEPDLVYSASPLAVSRIGGAQVRVWHAHPDSIPWGRVSFPGGHRRYRDAVAIWRDVPGGWASYLARQYVLRPVVTAWFVYRNPRYLGGGAGSGRTPARAGCHTETGGRWSVCRDDGRWVPLPGGPAAYSGAYGTREAAEREIEALTPIAAQHQPVDLHVVYLSRLPGPVELVRIDAARALGVPLAQQVRRRVPPDLTRRFVPRVVQVRG